MTIMTGRLTRRYERKMRTDELIRFFAGLEASRDTRVLSPVTDLLESRVHPDVMRRHQCRIDTLILEHNRLGLRLNRIGFQ